MEASSYAKFFQFFFQFIENLLVKLDSRFSEKRLLALKSAGTGNSCFESSVRKNLQKTLYPDKNTHRVNQWGPERNSSAVA